MGKASSSKKVSRAASTGGGRTARGKTPVLWYTAMTTIVVLGALGVAQSRSELAARPDDKTPPTVDDHWHAAYGVYVCDKFLPPISNTSGSKGIHTHAAQTGGGDGVIHIHPTTSKAAGQNATLRRFAEAVEMDVTRTELDPPGDGSWRNGDDCTIDGKKVNGEVQLFIDGERIEGDPLEYKFQRDRQQVVWAFVPKDTEVPPPPSVPNLDNLSDVEPAVPPGSELPEGEPGAPADPAAPTAPADPAATPDTSAPAPSDTTATPGTSAP